MGSVGGVEVDHVVDGLLADGAEDGSGVGAHAAVLCAAPDALALVAAALEEADALYGAAAGASGAREGGEAAEEAAAEAVRLIGDDVAVRENGTRREHVLPFRREVGEGGNVGLPGLGVGVVHLDVLIVVEVFVGEAGKAVAEFVDDDGFELGMMGGGQRVGVVDASAAVGVGVGEDDDMLVGEAGEHVMQLLDP